jgi:hypothetical protein
MALAPVSPLVWVAVAEGRSAKGRTRARADRVERVNLTIVAVFESECYADDTVW